MVPLVLPENLRRFLRTQGTNFVYTFLWFCDILSQNEIFSQGTPMPP